MKRTLVALAIASACSIAYAQSSVSIFAVLDATVESVHNSGGANILRLTNSGWQASRFGFRGTEDLGGGLSASFWLEMGVSVDDGTGAPSNTNNQTTGGTPAGALMFNRRSTVSLSGQNWGELRLGRDIVPGAWTLVLYDPFFNVGVGASQAFNSAITGITTVRASNSIGYWTPSTLGGFFGHFMYWLGENPSTAANKKDGSGSGFRVGYVDSKLDLSVSMNKTNYLAGDTKQNNIGASWNFGWAKLMGSLSSDRNGATRAKGGDAGATVPVGAGQIKIAYSRYRIERPTGQTPTASKIALGYDYMLSKRTTLYTSVARLQNSNGSAATVSFGAPAPGPDGSSRGINAGLRHTF